MTPLSLKDRLVRYMQQHHTVDWIPSGDLQRIVMQYTSYTPQNVGRRLRELHNEGVLEVRYVKGHAQYRATITLPVEELNRKGVEWFNSLPSAEKMEV